MSSINFKHWTDATADLDWGVQRVMKETLNLVAEGKITLAHSTNVALVATSDTDSRTAPCLVNAVAQMLSADGDVSPVSWFPNVVGAFDAVNRSLVEAGVNEHEKYIVSPLAAEVLIANFGEMKPVPTENDYKEAALEALKKEAEAAPYIEPTDEEMAKAWETETTAPVGVADVPMAEYIETKMLATLKPSDSESWR